MAHRIPKASKVEKEEMACWSVVLQHKKTGFLAPNQQTAPGNTTNPPAQFHPKSKRPLRNA
jgi:hypothetical protein